jgi:hypothetical protein
VERRDILRSDRDREDFLARLARLLGEEDVALCAYVLMGDYFDLLLRRGRTSLGRFMRRLLTGYTGAFNRRHQRAGPLFQNRYHSVRCEPEALPVAAGALRAPEPAAGEGRARSGRLLRISTARVAAHLAGIRRDDGV